MRFVPFFQNRALDFRHWTVKVTDDRQRPVMIVMFPTRKQRRPGNDDSTAKLPVSLWGQENVPKVSADGRFTLKADMR
jgi:hypothetical protein